jgi:putative flippase GtrA
MVVVDDGSAPEFRSRFEEVRTYSEVALLQHAVNLGKGAALRTGFNHALYTWPEIKGVVTADADGQHSPTDIVRVARRLLEAEGSLVLGVRAFSGQVPLRSRFGNTVTRWLVGLLVGQRLTDTQTGLRGIPASLVRELLRVPSSGYEFELDMLITAKHWGYPLVQESVQTIYEDGNSSSHFNPLRDSMRIYMVLIRFSAVAVLTAIADNVTFWLAFRATGYVAVSQVCGRAVGVLFNYRAARNAVFLSEEKHRTTLPKYLLLVAVNGCVSYLMIAALTSRAGLKVLPAKLLAESILFAANFAIQRDFIFTHKQRQDATDWTAYYRTSVATPKASRRYTSSVLTTVLRRYARPEPVVIEIGGANSCFLDELLRVVRPREYHVVDLNEYGLELLRKRLDGRSPVVLHRQDVRSLQLPVKADVVFSVGLVEHFDRVGTAEVVGAHLAVLAAGGIAVISFPTPTLFYRCSRRLTELAGLWKFPDERPLRCEEVTRCLAGHGRVVFEKTLWPLVFTQHLIVFQKDPA